MLNEEHAPTSDGAWAAGHKVLAEFENCDIANHCTYMADVVAPEGKCAQKDMVSNELWTTLKISLDDVLKKSIYNAQSGIR